MKNSPHSQAIKIINEILEELVILTIKQKMQEKTEIQAFYNLCNLFKK
ncbi:hypothetical protein [Oceanobacillus profundus]|nr:hypothetical protein [Oceanobacillus profundus]MBR3121649.1 hypothetical protein [Oceanobacillus sp.]MCM3399867.1 hypothetical protein [Oceanobacillus profundus]